MSSRTIRIQTSPTKLGEYCDAMRRIYRRLSNNMPTHNSENEKRSSSKAARVGCDLRDDTGESSSAFGQRVCRSTTRRNGLELLDTEFADVVVFD